MVSHYFFTMNVNIFGSVCKPVVFTIILLCECLFTDFQLLILSLALNLVSLESASTCSCGAHKNVMNFLPVEKRCLLVC